MIQIPFESLDDAIDTAVASPGVRVVLSDPSEPVGFDGKTSEFLCTFAHMVKRHDAPDYPGDAGAEHWPATLGMTGPMLAVWNFDHYQLSLSLEGDQIVLSNHGNQGIGFVTDDGRRAL